MPPLASGDAWSAEQIDNLPFLEAVIQESLRFWSVVPRQTRLPIRPVTIAGEAIPPGTLLVNSFYATNRATKNWGPDAATFRPERWLGSSEAKAYGGAKDRSAFSTFSHGAKSCIGYKFAHFEMLVFLAGLVGSFEWEFVDKPGLPPGVVKADHDSTIMLKLDGGLQLKATPVEGW